MDFNSYAEVSSMAGVGLFFQQDVPGIIFVSSVVPGAAAARSGIVKKGDIVVKVDEHSVDGFSLAKLRKLILGIAGSHLTITFLRKTTTHTNFYYDVDLMRGTGDFLEVVERQRHFMVERDRLASTLAKQEKIAADLERDIQTLINHPPLKVEDPRVRELAAEAKSRLEDLRRLEQSVQRSREWLRDAERSRAEAAERHEAQRQANLAEDAKDRDRLNYLRDLERRHADERALQETVRDKLRHDVRLEGDARAAAEAALQQALAQLHRAKEEVMRMRTKEDAYRRRVEDLHDHLKKVYRMSELSGQELAACVPAVEAGHSWFLSALKAGGGGDPRIGGLSGPGFGPDAVPLFPLVPAGLALHRPLAGAAGAGDSALGPPAPPALPPLDLGGPGSQALDVDAIAYKHGLRLEPPPPPAAAAAYAGNASAAPYAAHYSAPGASPRLPT